MPNYSENLQVLLQNYPGMNKQPIDKFIIDYVGDFSILPEEELDEYCYPIEYEYFDIQEKIKFASYYRFAELINEDKLRMSIWTKKKLSLCHTALSETIAILKRLKLYFNDYLIIDSDDQNIISRTESLKKEIEKILADRLMNIHFNIKEWSPIQTAKIQSKEQLQATKDQQDSMADVHCHHLKSHSPCRESLSTPEQQIVI